MSRPFAPILVAGVLLAGCTAEEPSHAGPVVRDSAGIRIVENRTPTWTPETAWRLGPEPTVLIGGGSAEEEQLFRVRDAVRLPDGRIVIANAGTHELRFYDGDGVFLSASGGRGGGPGEFESLSMLRRYRGDSLVAYDSRHRRVSVHDARGAFVRNVPLRYDAEDGFARVTDVFESGDFLVQVLPVFTPASESGFHRNDVTAVRLSPDLTVGDTLGRFPGMENFAQTFDAGGGGGVVVSSLIFGRSTDLQTFGDGLFAATNDTYEVRIFDAASRLHRIVRRIDPLVPVTDEAIDRFRSDRLAAMENDVMRRRFEDLYDDMPAPETFPAYTAIRVDTQGNLWVRMFNRPGDDRVVWSVFDADGARLGDLEFPVGFGTMDIGPDYVLGRWTDDLDVEYVQLFELIKG